MPILGGILGKTKSAFDSAPDTLPADFKGWDQSSAPDTLPADFKGFDAATQTPAAATQPAKPGILSRAWNWANKGLVSGKAITEPLTAWGGASYDVMKKEQDYLDPNEKPWHAAVRRGIAGTGVAAADTLSSFTSPLSVALFGAGAAAQGGKAAQAAGAVGPVGKLAARIAPIASRISTAASLGFGAKGVNDVVDAAQAPGSYLDPETGKLQQTLTGLSMVAGGGAGAGEVVKSVRSGPGLLSKRMAQTPAGDRFSRGEMYNTAQDHGVNLDLADATGSAALKGAKGYVERSLGGRGTMKANTDSNVSALQDWAHDELRGYAADPMGREQIGNAVQKSLRDAHAKLKEEAATGFHQLDDEVGPSTIDGTETVEAEARKIVDEMGEYYAKHPQLKPKQAWSTVENLATRPEVNKVNPNATTPGLMDAGGKQIYATGTVQRAPAQQHTFSWSELHQLRSDLMEEYRNSSDITKSKSEQWLQRLVGKVDEAMTNQSSHLTPEQLTTFRDANSLWENMKGTYDNPSHPYYAAVRAEMPSQVTTMLHNKTPELARQAQETLGTLKGQFQRDFVERLLDPKGSGVMDFKNLNRVVNSMPDEYLTAMLGEQGARNVRLLARTAKTVTDNMNPSGTSDVLVPGGEIGMLLTHPAAGAATIGSAYGGAKALTSPGLMKGLTKPASPGGRAPVSARPGIAAAAGNAAGSEDQEVPDGFIRVKSHLRRTRPKP